MSNLASLVLDDKEAIQHSECHRRHGEEIEGSDYLAVILEKGEPPLAGTPRRTVRRRYRATVRSTREKPSFCSSA